MNLINDLKTGIVEFTYVKLNGEERKAKGTLNLELIPENSHPKTNITSGNPDMIRYWDVTKEAWRTFDVNTTIY